MQFFSNPRKQDQTCMFLKTSLFHHFTNLVKSRVRKKRESRPGILEFLQVTAAGAQLALQRKLTDGLDDFC